VEGDAVKGERRLACGQAHDVEPGDALVEHQLRVLAIKHLAVLRGADELCEGGIRGEWVFRRGGPRDGARGWEGCAGRSRMGVGPPAAQQAVC
jgi:hypothetical protein